MTKPELRRAAVLARAETEELRLTDAGADAVELTAMPNCCGSATSKAGGCVARPGHKSNRARPEKERKKILKQVREKYKRATDFRKKHGTGYEKRDTSNEARTGHF